MPQDEWTPLLSTVGEETAEKFMYMGMVGNILMYKHKENRMYLNIDQDGQFWTYTNGQYLPIDRAAAFERVGLRIERRYGNS